MNKFILDNGAYWAKSGFYTDKTPKLTPNFITKTKNGQKIFVGSEIDDCKDFSALFYNLAFHKGILVNYDLQRQVWNQLFKKHNVDFSNTSLIITEALFNFAYTQECMEEIFFEEYCFEGLIRAPAPTLAGYKYMKENRNDFCLVVDSGYSFTHIVPYFRGKILLDGVKRVNVGGKHLTNYLKEVVSYRQLMMMDETYVVNQIKEEVCFVSTDFESDMKIAKSKENTIVREYVLPDFSNIRKGYAKPQGETSTNGASNDAEQILRLNNECFTIPELLFHPSDIGIQEMGISEAIVHSVESCPKETRPNLYANVVLIGGNTLFKGFRDRVFKDVRSMVSDEFDLNVQLSDEVLHYPWQGGHKLANSDDFADLVVTKKQYDEHGHNICKQKFNIC